MNRARKKSSESTWTQLLRYGVVGGIAAIVDIGSFAVFTRYFAIDYRIALLFSFSLGVLTNFSICNTFVFKQKLSPIWLVLSRHYWSSLYGLFLNEAFMIFMVEFLHFNYLIVAKIIGTGIAFINNFLIKKFYVYNNGFYSKKQKK